jgi:hypothetical protein
MIHFIFKTQNYIFPKNPIINPKIKTNFKLMNLINYKTKYKDKEIQDFIEYFLTSAYVNMDIEDEAVFDKDELYTRYRFILDDLINQ